MNSISMSKNSIKIIKLIMESEMSVSEIASELDKSISWVSRCISHLEEIGIIEKKDFGITRIIRISDNELGNSVSTLFREDKMLNFNDILSYKKIELLILLLPPGYSIKQILARSKISKSTIEKNIRKWRYMGLVYKKEKRYIINPRQKNLKKLLMSIAKKRNSSILKKNGINGIILWQWKDEFLFSVNDEIENNKFKKGGLSQLKELNYDIIHDNEYYFYNPIVDKMSIEEIIVQSMKIDPNNPRMAKLLKKSVEKREIDIELLLMYGKKYGMKTRIKEVIN